MSRFLDCIFVAAVLVGFGSCNNVDELDDLNGDGSTSDTDSDTDTDTDTGTDTDTDTDTNSDSDTNTETSTDTGADVYDYQYNAVCCDGVPATCADLGATTAEQEAGCCLWGSPDDTLYACLDGELLPEGCSGACGWDAATEKMACLDEPFPTPCFTRYGNPAWDTEFFEFPTGTICCDGLPATCADVGPTPEAQFIGCCEADAVHWCSGGELHSEACVDGNPCAWADDGLMWCMSPGYGGDPPSPCPSF